MAACSSSMLVGGPSLPPPFSLGPTSSSNHNVLVLHQATKVEAQQTRQVAKDPLVCRRDMLCLTAQALAAVTFWSVVGPKPAEARINRSEIRRRFAEKLERLREKAGLAKPKPDEEKKTPSGKDED